MSIFKRKSLHLFGGNSGYDGYSMSIRAREARDNGRFPKTDFRSYYRITLPSFNVLVRLLIIDGTEWHHTGCYGRRTTFYSWMFPKYWEIYKQNKQQIDRLAREGKDKEIGVIFNK